MKSILQSLDLVVKIAVAAFLIVGIQKDQAETEKTRLREDSGAA